LPPAPVRVPRGPRRLQRGRALRPRRRAAHAPPGGRRGRSRDRRGAPARARRRQGERLPRAGVAHGERAALRADRVRRRSRDRQGHIGTGGGAQRLRPVRRSLSGRSGAVESDRSRTTKSQVDRDRRSGTQGRTPMTAIRVLVGTRKGAFILTSDGKREQWTVAGPHFAGWEVYHMKGSPADPDRIYASQSSSWFGQVIQRSRDGG